MVCCDQCGVNRELSSPKHRETLGDDLQASCVVPSCPRERTATASWGLLVLSLLSGRCCGSLSTDTSTASQKKLAHEWDWRRRHIVKPLQHCTSRHHIESTNPITGQDGGVRVLFAQAVRARCTRILPVSTMQTGTGCCILDNITELLCHSASHQSSKNVFSNGAAHSSCGLLEGCESAETKCTHGCSWGPFPAATVLPSETTHANPWDCPEEAANAPRPSLMALELLQCTIGAES